MIGIGETGLRLEGVEILQREREARQALQGGLLARASALSLGRRLPPRKNESNSGMSDGEST